MINDVKQCNTNYLYNRFIYLKFNAKQLNITIIIIINIKIMITSILY
jgi:hypothetical protein